MRFLAVLIFLGVVINLISKADAGFWIISSCVVVFVIIFWMISASDEVREDSEKKEKQRKYIRDKSLEYKKALAKKRTQLVFKDDYGDIDDLKWKQEIVKFFNSKIGSIPGELALSTSEKIISAEEIGEIIDSVAREGQVVFDELYSYSEDMSGIDYEHFCAYLLREYGWEATVSQASNDQGADIIAEKNGIKVAIQCKKYASPVGNKAVQEVTASKFHYGTDLAAVVTNSSFTSSAKQLANSTDVLLLHHGDLESLEELI